MSAAHELLDQLAKIGATVEPAGDRLILRAGAMGVPGALVDRLRQAKTEMLATLASIGGASCTYPDTLRWRAAEWRARHLEALRFWGGFHAREDAAAIAWGELVNLWHQRNGERIPPDICAGCRTPIHGAEALSLSDGTCAHLETLECVIAYGKRWRGAAKRALTAMGLTPPTKDDG